MSVAGALDPANKLSLVQAASAVLESRTDYRVGADFPVQIHSPDFDPPLPARARDISAGGICIATPSPFVLKGVHGLTLHLPTGPIHLEVDGRWQKHVTIDEAVLSGLSFVRFSPAQVSRLWDVIHDTARELASFLYKSLSAADPTIDDAMNIAQLSRLRLVGRQKFIYQRGDAAEHGDAIFIIRRGAVDLHLPMNGGRDVQMARLGPGDLFGGLATVASIPSLESARTDEETMLLEISQASFAYTRLARPLLAHWLGGLVMKSYLGRVETLVDRAADLLRG